MRSFGTMLLIAWTILVYGWWHRAATVVALTPNPDWGAHQADLGDVLVDYGLLWLLGLIVLVGAAALAYAMLWYQVNRGHRST